MMILDCDQQYQKLGAHGDKDLCPDVIGRISEELLHHQILLESLEKQFDLLAVLADIYNRQCRRVVKVEQERQILVGLGNVNRHAAQPLQIPSFRLWRCQQKCFFGMQPGDGIYVFTRSRGRARGVLGTKDEANLTLVQGKQPCEIHIALVDHQNGIRRQVNLGEQADVAGFPLRNVYEYGGHDPQIHDYMGLHGSLGTPEMRPWEQPPVQVDGSRVHGEDRSLQPFGVVGQGRVGDRSPNFDVVEHRALCVESGDHQIAQYRAARQLGVGRADKMASGRESSHSLVGLLDIDKMLKVVEGSKLQQLCSDCHAVLHGCALSEQKSGNDMADRLAGSLSANSIRRNYPSAGKQHQDRLCAC